MNAYGNTGNSPQHSSYPIGYEGYAHESEAMIALTSDHHLGYGYPVPSNLMLSMPSMPSGVIASPLYENVSMSPMFSPQSDVYPSPFFSLSGSSTPHHPQEQVMYPWPVIPGPGSYVTAHLPQYPRGSVMLQTMPTSEVLYGPGPPIVTGDTIRGPDGCNLFVFHLPNEMTNWDLYNLFKRFGTILSVHIMINKQSGLSRGFGFVSFQIKDDADQAIRSMNGFRIGNKRLKVQPKRRGQKFDHADFSEDQMSGAGYDRRESEQAAQTTEQPAEREAKIPPQTEREVKIPQQPEREGKVPQQLERELKLAQPSTTNARPRSARSPRSESIPQVEPSCSESSDAQDIDSITPTTQTTGTTFESSPGSAKVILYED